MFISYSLLLHEEFTINFIFHQIPNLNTEQRILHKLCQMQHMLFQAVVNIYKMRIQLCWQCRHGVFIKILLFSFHLIQFCLNIGSRFHPLWIIFQQWLGNAVGNPGVFQGNPHLCSKVRVSWGFPMGLELCLLNL